MTSFTIETGVSKIQGDRPHQEDTFNIIEKYWDKGGFSFFSIFDGHGSNQYSLHAKNHLFQYLIESQDFEKKNFLDALRNAFLQENEAMRGKKN